MARPSSAQQAEHPLAVDEVLRAAEADEGDGRMGFLAAGMTAPRLY